MIKGNLTYDELLKEFLEIKYNIYIQTIDETETTPYTVKIQYKGEPSQAIFENITDIEKAVDIFLMRN